MLNGRYSSAEYVVRLDLDLDAALLDEQFCLVPVMCCEGVDRVPERPQAHGGGLERRGNLRECGVAIDLVIAIDKIEINGQSRHIAHEEIDRRAALERKSVVMEDDRRDADEEPRRVEIVGRHGLSTNSPSGDR